MFKSTHFIAIALTILAAIGLVACDQGGGTSGGSTDGGDANGGATTGAKAGGYTILGVRTDQFDKARAKQQVEDTLTAHPNVKGMVGLFAYNPPAIIDVLRDADMLDQVEVFGFDEQNATLQGIIDGHVHGTISQVPFNYGYESVKICKAMIDGDDSVIPQGGVIDMPLLAVKKDNVDKFWADLKAALASAKDAGNAPADNGDKKTIAFITNGIDPFWDIAAAGARKAAAELGVNVRVLMPPNGVGDQNRMIEEMIAAGVHAMAISPIDKVNQNSVINEAAKAMPVMTFDSDAPDSDRRLFLGVDNLKAGRAVGKLIKEALPEGGQIMIFIGRLDQLNATQRTQGVIDELLGLPAGETAMDDPKRNYSATNIHTPAP